ncbi:MAG: RNA methyltransferase, partial [Sporomusaceae bacterium]|nr:RNA methyltransferase [Sporomusaceae bacterium]
MMIHSVQNKLIKKIASLKQKKYRDELNLFSLEGSRLAEEALASGWDIEICLYCQDAPENSRVALFLEKLSLVIDPANIIEVSTEVYAKITDTKEPQGIMLVLPQRVSSLAEVFASCQDKKSKIPLLAVLDGVSDPGNAGAIIRTAAAAGCAGVILLSGSADLFNGKTLRAAMGAIFQLPIVTEVDRKDFAALCQTHGIKILAAALDKDAQVYYRQNWQNPLAIVLGNEGNGISAEIL